MPAGSVVLHEGGGKLVSSSPNARNYVSGEMAGGTGDGKKEMDTKDTDGRQEPQRLALRRTLIYIELRRTLVPTSNGFSEGLRRAASEIPARNFLGIHNLSRIDS